MNKEEKILSKGFKGFNPDMTCRGKQYAVNTIFEECGGFICDEGVMHFCSCPMDVLSYYPPVSKKGELNKFAKVEALAACQGCADKYATTKLKICEELNLEELISEEIKTIEQATTKGSGGHSSTTEGFAHSGTTRDGAHSSTSGGYEHSYTTGEGAYSYTAGHSAHSCTTGNSSFSCTAEAFSHSITKGRFSHSTTMGYKAHSSTTGNFSHAFTTGLYACATTIGDNAHSCSTGDHTLSCTKGAYSHAYAAGMCSKAATSGENAIAAAFGFHGRAKATIGGWIVLVEYDKKDGHIVAVKSTVVDGEKILPDTYYELINGEFVAVD